MKAPANILLGIIAVAFATENVENFKVNDDPSQAPAICAEDNSNGVLVSHENCNKFYMCANNIPVAMQCYGDLYFNPYNGQCDRQENVDCVSKVEVQNYEVEEKSVFDDPIITVKEVNDDPSHAPAICAKENSDGVLVSHENCNKFYICANNIPVAMQCYGDLYFNPYNGQCDRQENVDCVSKIEVQNYEEKPVYDDPSMAPVICAEKDSNGILVSHEKCNFFYKCAHGVPVARECPSTLLFNPELEQCDWPRNVNCGGRVITA